MLDDCAPFDLRFILLATPGTGCVAHQAYLRGIYPAPRVARRAGMLVATALGWAFLDATPTLRHPYLDAEWPLLELLEARPPTDALAYGLIVEPGVPHYVLVALGDARPLARFAQRADPATQISELCHCLRVGFGQREPRRR